MIVFPFDSFVQTLKFGTVLRFNHPDFDEKPYFFIIADYSNTTHPPVISLISSKSDKNKRCFITITEKEYSGFKRLSYVSCDKTYDFTAETLYSLYSQQRLEILDTMPHATMEKIVCGCQSSKTIARGTLKRMKVALDNACSE